MNIFALPSRDASLRSSTLFASQARAQISRAPADPGALVERARDLEEVLAADPVRACEALRGVFENGCIEMHPIEDGGYVAKATFLPPGARLPTLRLSTTRSGGTAEVGGAAAIAAIRANIQRLDEGWGCP